MIKISKHILLMLLFYVVDIFACSNLNLPIVNSYNSIEFYNGKGIETLSITSTKQPYYCVLILSECGIPLSKGEIYFDKSTELLKEALSHAYLNPAQKWWSIELYQKNDLNHPYANLNITPKAECYNGGLIFEIIEYREPYYFISIKLKDKSIHQFGFIKSKSLLNEKDFDFILLDEIYTKNNDKYELLSCHETNFDCNLARYSHPYQFFESVQYSELFR
ncbi:hypothetical protein A9G34_03715 [Gilliamella sp. Choc4-2]|jgi:hypothetical protein|uniref:hypothetical protein n=1 Tax=Gilliamella sp. Choc4-2 TaxID=3120237 RepID=UPI00080ED7E9|nr:hypothetical protein [Gilliamella apicola]OCG46980.1 hypothetical protein A9G34_03715 [Gilliamella apicola]